MFPDMPRECARIDAANAADIIFLEPFIERNSTAEIRGEGGALAQDEANCAEAGFQVSGFGLRGFFF